MKTWYIGFSYNDDDGIMDIAYSQDLKGLAGSFDVVLEFELPPKTKHYKLVEVTGVPGVLLGSEVSRGGL